MNTDPSYRYLLSPNDLAALHEIADREWSSIAWAHADRCAGLSVRCSAVRITAGKSVVTIGVRSRELESQVEAFRLTVGLPGEWPQPEWYKPPAFVDSDEIMSAFIGTSHRLAVGGRQFTFKPGGGGALSVMVEDVLVIRHHSGQQAFVCVDDKLPGSVFVTRDRHSIPSPDIDFAYLRMI